MLNFSFYILYSLIDETKSCAALKVLKMQNYKRNPLRYQLFLFGKTSQEQKGPIETFIRQILKRNLW